MKVVFADKGWEDLSYWVSHDRKIAKGPRKYKFADLGVEARGRQGAKTKEYR